MKPLLILFLSSLILFSHCENIPIVGEKKKSSALKNFNERTLLVCWIGRYTIIKETKIIDNKDGTIALADVTTQGTDYCLLPLGKTESITVKYYIKKCIQGQVYRQAQNDCKGTGTAANYYGAQKFQMCVTNVSCAESGSPVSLSCKNESIGNRTWKAKSFWDFDAYPSIKDYYKSRSDEIPVALSDFYWEYLFRLTNINGTQYAVYYSGTDLSLDSFNYVLCFAI